jgi:hypothetical protein
MANQRGETLGNYFTAAHRIVDAMPIAASIDNFIEATSGDYFIEQIGKMAIASSILEAESRSKLYFDPGKSSKLSLNALSGHWHAFVCRYLVEAVHADDVNKIFEKVSFVIFNYDRCVETFFYHALQAYYHLTSASAATILNGARFIHPYGVVGDLPWQSVVQPNDFGQHPDGHAIMRAVPNIVTFSESRTSEKRSEIEKLLKGAETIVFLGFSFLEQNMSLLTTETRIRRIYATALNFSKSDCEQIKIQISKTFSVPRDDMTIEVRSDLDAIKLLSEYSKSITQ